jgi:hypothetical protein
MFLPKLFPALGLAALLHAALLSASVANVALLRPKDVIAFVGGEDMVAASEAGYVELAITRALPDHQLKFRSLAWEADTVYEQKRDLNYPTLEQQLDQIGATVVIAQFGQAESFDGPGGVDEFAAAYERLLDRLTAKGRRVILIPPTAFSRSPLALPFDVAAANARLQPYQAVIRSDRFLRRADTLVVDGNPPAEFANSGDSVASGSNAELSRDGCHLSDLGHRVLAARVARTLDDTKSIPERGDGAKPLSTLQTGNEKLLTLINEKNRLWFHYYRPQNWAFLAGDRTNQPSSRDHLDLTKRWFPEELQRFLPLIDEKELEIHNLLAKGAQQ